MPASRRTASAHRWSSSERLPVVEQHVSVVEERALPVVEQRAERAISRDPDAVDRLTGFRDRTSSFLNQRQVPVVEQRGLDRLDHQDAISRDHPDAVDRLTRFRDRTSSFLNQRVPVVEQRTGGRAASGASDQSRPDAVTAHRWSSQRGRRSERSVETTPTRSIASPGFETGLRPSSTSGRYRWSSSEGRRPVVEQRAERAISRDHHRRGRSPHQGFETGLRPSSTTGGYRWSSRERLVPVVEQRGLDSARPPRRDQSRPPPTRSIASPGFRDRTSSFLNQRQVPVVEQATGGRAASSTTQDAISRDHHDAVDRLTGFRDRTSSFLNQRQVPVVEQRGLDWARPPRRDQSRPPPRTTDRMPAWTSTPSGGC